MPQVKKNDKRDAILASAFDLFSRQGYGETTMAEIAKAANTTAANLYVYFPSKLLILYEIYTPWLDRQMKTLAEAVKKFRSPRTRLRRIFIGVWSDIPEADHAFANSLVEALAQAPRNTIKPSDLLVRSEESLSAMILDALPEPRRNAVPGQLLAHVIWMAFDGFAINRRLGDKRDIDAIAELMTNLLLGGENEAP